LCPGHRDQAAGLEKAFDRAVAELEEQPATPPVVEVPPAVGGVDGWDYKKGRYLPGHRPVVAWRAGEDE